MCGILGFFANTALAADRQRMTAAGHAMAQTIAHRGPDDEGLWQDEAVPLLLGHRRLSILDLSPEGHQPMVSASGRFVIAFNGEIYNFLTLRAELEQGGATFRGRSDTEIMLAAVEHWGINAALQKFEGMFAFALWDRKERTLHLARDRFGKKPLYVGWAGGGFTFASELKAFRAHPDFTPDIDRNALTLFVRYGYVTAPYSIYKGVWTIPAGCRLTLSADQMTGGGDLSAKMEAYWSPRRALEESKQRGNQLSERDTIDAFETLLKSCVKDRMVSDVPLGSFLSGGIDSSAITALMQSQSSQPIKTFSIGFKESGYDESAAAKAVAQHLGTDHRELIVTPQDALKIIPELPTIYDEPFADPSQIPTLILSRFAREYVTVALSGDGGDEMLGGYLRHTTVPRLWNKIHRIPMPLRHAAASGIHAVKPDVWDHLNPRHPQFGERLYKFAELLPLKTPEEWYRAMIGVWSDPASIVIGGSEPPIPLTTPTLYPQGLSFAEKMMFGDTISYMPNDVLVKVDRASMAASMEVRAPLLDRRVFDFAWTLPHSMKVRDSKGKWLLRQVLARHVPPALFDRPKQGFGVPVADWLRHDLRDWAESLLDESRLKNEGFFDPAPVRREWNAHLAGHGRHGTKLWTILMFQAWRDI